MAKLALRGGTPVRRKEFTAWPVFDRKEEKALLDVLRGRIWRQSRRVTEFEKRFAAFQDAKYGVAVCNGTAALEIALLALGVGAGDEVIVPAYTFVATAVAALRVNAVPVFADIDPATLCIDPAEVERLITDRTRAVVPVHFAGHPADMSRITAIARKAKINVVEDAAHGWGSQWKGRGVGAIGDAGTFSFYAGKNITCGEGGMVLTNSKGLERAIRAYCNSGRLEGSPWYQHFVPGSNARMTEFQAALLLAQLTRLGRQTLKRQRNAEYLNSRLSRIKGIGVLGTDRKVSRRAYHIFIFKYDSGGFGGVPREVFIKALNAEGIPASEGYPFPVYKNPLFARKGSGPESCPLSCTFYGRDVDYSAVCCPVAERTSLEEAVWIRHPLLLGNRRDMDDIADAIAKIREHSDELA